MFRSSGAVVGLVDSSIYGPRRIARFGSIYGTEFFIDMVDEFFGPPLGFGAGDEWACPKEERKTAKGYVPNDIGKRFPPREAFSVFVGHLRCIPSVFITYQNREVACLSFLWHTVSVTVLYIYGFRILEYLLLVLFQRPFICGALVASKR